MSIVNPSELPRFAPGAHGDVETCPCQPVCVVWKEGRSPWSALDSESQSAWRRLVLNQVPVHPLGENDRRRDAIFVAAARNQGHRDGSISVMVILLTEEYVPRARRVHKSGKDAHTTAQKDGTSSASLVSNVGTWCSPSTHYWYITRLLSWD